MDPNRPYYRYGYNYNGGTRLPPIESFDDFEPSEQPSGYAEPETFPPPRVEDHDSNYRPDNPFLPRSSAEDSASLAPIQGYQGYEYRQRPYSPVREYRQSSGYDQMEQLQSHFHPNTSYPRSDTIDAYAPQGFSNPFAVGPGSPPPRYIQPPDYEFERPADYRSDNPFAPAASSAQPQYSQGFQSQPHYTGPSYAEDSGLQRQGGSIQSPQRMENTRWVVTCVNCKDTLRNCAPRCDSCLWTYQQHVERGTTPLEARYCIKCQVTIYGLRVTCDAHCGRRSFTQIQMTQLGQQGMCRICFSGEVDPCRTRCERCWIKKRNESAAWRQRTRERGLCLTCGAAPAEHERVYYAECGRKNRERQRGVPRHRGQDRAV